MHTCAQTPTSFRLLRVQSSKTLRRFESAFETCLLYKTEFKVKKYCRHCLRVRESNGSAS
jgi:hypothetical protein